MYWEIGKRITEQQATLGWGKAVVETLSHDIQKEFPGILGFSARDMWLMAKFYTEYQDNKIPQTLLAEISWFKHIVILSKCKDKASGTFFHLFSISNVLLRNNIKPCTISTYRFYGN